MTTLPAFAHERPQTLADALALIGEEAVPYGGGTELLLAMRIGLLRPAVLVDLKRIPELREIRLDGDDLWIGAGASHVAVSRDPLVAQHAAVLVDVERAVGNARVRHAGTLGGNLCFAEPKSDVTTTLLALDASVVLASARGRRTLPMGEFLLGPYWTDREADELLVAVTVPREPDRVAVYAKFQTMERPTLGVAAVGWRGSARRRLVLGAATEVPVRIDGDDPLDADTVAADLDCVADLTGSVAYKRHIAAVYARRALGHLEEMLHDA